MNKKIERLKNTRKYLLTLIEGLSIEQLNEVPASFNNNIIWNLAHLIAAQQGICYLRAEVKPFISDEFYATYKPGTKPEKFLTADKIDEIKQLFISALEQFEKDYDNNLFTKYNSWTTRYLVELTNIDDALEFVLFHEGLHLGYIMALQRLVKKQQPAQA